MSDERVPSERETRLLKYDKAVLARYLDRCAFMLSFRQLDLMQLEYELRLAQAKEKATWEEYMKASRSCTDAMNGRNGAVAIAKLRLAREAALAKHGRASAAQDRVFKRFMDWDKPSTEVKNDGTK